MNLLASWNQNWTTALVNHLWQSTVVVAIAWLLALALRKNHARVRYWIWMAASVKFLLPFSLLMSAGEWMRSFFAVPVVAQPALANAMVQIAQPFTRTQFFDATPTVAAAHHANWLPVGLLVAWACGALIVAVRFGRGWMRVYAAKRAARLLALAADVLVLSSPASIEPGIFGIFRPVLLMPGGILQRLSPGQLRAIIAHEMCHVRRRDNLTFVIHMVVETLFWFHPAVWWIGAWLIEERERACDEVVLQSGSEAETYAEGILSVCRFYVESPLACVVGVTGADLKQRIARIMTNLAIHEMSFGRKLLLVSASVMAIAAPVALGVVQLTRVNAQTAPAQGIVGIWQGTLTLPNASHGTRYVITISKGNGGSYTATLLNADQPNPPLTFDSVTLQDTNVKLASPMITVEGKLSADGKTIDAKWSAGRILVPISFARAAPDAAWPIPEPIKPMAADAHPEFEVVTIKPGRPNTPGKMFRIAGTHFGTVNMDLDDLMMFAYGVHIKQMMGAPDWADKDLFDIDGVPNVPGQANQEQMREMIQKLLADRFQLKIHHEIQELSVYAIRVANGGPKLTRSKEAPGGPSGFKFRGLGDLAAVNVTMTEFARGMQSSVTDRPVEDQTGLTDHYDFTLVWTPDDSQFRQVGGAGAAAPVAGDNPNAPPSLYTAVQEQLGLKIEATRAPDDVIVIDHVEKPSAN